MEYKTSEKFKETLDEFLLEIPLHFIDFQDIYYKGQCVITKKKMKEWVVRRPEIPLGIKLEQLEDYVLELIFGTVRRREDADKRNQIKQEIQKFTGLDLASLYMKFICDRDCFRAMSEEMSDKLRKHAQDAWESGRLNYEDAIAIAYLHLRIYGLNAYRNIKQVVIDEAQDYYPLQYEIFRLLFPNAKFTVLGDINQTLAKQEDVTFYEQIQKILNKKNSSLITLDKSFRCTNEILEFSLQFIEHRPEIESFNRKGEKPQVVSFKSHTELQDAIMKEVNLCREKGFETICLICKTEKNAVHLFRDLQNKLDIRLIKDNKIESLKGTFIMPVYMSKGLEFDAVIVCDVNARNYSDEDDRKLLYVECTRALHRLSLFGEGDSPDLEIIEMQ